MMKYEEDLEYKRWKDHQISLGNIEFAEYKFKWLYEIGKDKPSNHYIYPYKNIGFVKKFKNHLRELTTREVTKHSNLTIDDYLYKVFEGGITSPTEIGTFAGAMQLCRDDDFSPYCIDNCRFKTREENRKDYVRNGVSKQQADKIRNVYNKDKINSGLNSGSFLGYYITPNGKFTSAQDAADGNGCSVMTAYNRCKNQNIVGWVFEEADRCGYIWHTPYGIFNSKKEASHVTGLGMTTIHNRCVNNHIKIRSDVKDMADFIGKTYKEAGWYKDV